MPPKKAQGPSKAEIKKKKQSAEDKTFGLKNKNKSAKVNRYVQQVQQQVAQSTKKVITSYTKNIT